MFVLNDDLSIYATRGDTVFFTVTAEDEGVVYKFKAGDVVRIKIFGKKDAETVVLQKDFPIYADTEMVEIYLTKEDTKIGEVISKPKDYWYEVELNPDTKAQTIIGYDEEGAKIFKLFPEGADLEEYIPDKEDIPVVDNELDLTSTRPVQNRAIARAIVSLKAAFEETEKSVAKQTNDVAEAVVKVETDIAVERARIDNLVVSPNASDAELVDVRIGANGLTYESAGTAVRTQFNELRGLYNQMRRALETYIPFNITEQVGYIYKPTEIQYTEGGHAYRYTEFDVEWGKKYRFNGFVTGHSSMFFEMYEDGTYQASALISTLPVASASANAYIDFEYTPSNAKVKSVMVNYYTKEGYEPLKVEVTGISEFTLEMVGQTLAKAESQLATIETENEYLKDRVLRLEDRTEFDYAPFDKAYVSFVFDDGWHDMDAIASVFAEFDLPLCLAIIPSRLGNKCDGLTKTVGDFTVGMTIKEVAKTVVENGGEVLSHNGEIFTEDNWEDKAVWVKKFITAKQTLKEAGFNVRGIITDGGTGSIDGNTGTTEQARKLQSWAAQYFEYSDLYGYSPNFYRPRKYLNNGADKVKEQISDAIKSKNWVTFYAHTFDGTERNVNVENMRKILQYCKDNGVKVVPYGYIFDNFSSTKIENRLTALENL